MNVLVLGATGLLGNAMFRRLSKAGGAVVQATIRRDADRALFAPALAGRLLVVDDLDRPDALTRLFDNVRPDVVVNCIATGRPAPTDPMRSILIYSVLPQQLSEICQRTGTRLVQISSDGVFTGARGAYTEADLPDAIDVYGVSKRLGEIANPHAVTLRTSIIGHELKSNSGLLEWFLSQQDQCRCHTRAIFSGFPTVVLADIIRDFVVPHPELQGIYHVASRPVSKYELLQMVAKRYKKDIQLIPDDRVVCDRSLIADRFTQATGYVAPEWPALIDAMYRDKFGGGEG